MPSSPLPVSCSQALTVCGKPCQPMLGTPSAKELLRSSLTMWEKRSLLQPLRVSKFRNLPSCGYARVRESPPWFRSPPFNGNVRGEGKMRGSERFHV